MVSVMYANNEDDFQEVHSQRDDFQEVNSQREEDYD